MQARLAETADAVRAGRGNDGPGYDAIYIALPESHNIIADFVPAVFDVDGNGSCFFYSLTYHTRHPSSPTTSSTSFGPDIEQAHNLRRTAVDMIEEDMKQMSTRYNEIFDSVATNSSHRHECADIRTSINYMISECDPDALFSLTRDTDVIDPASELIQNRLQSMRQTEITPHFYTIATISQRVAHIFPHNIIVVTVPNSWTHGFPSSVYDINRDCSVSDIDRGHTYSLTHDICPTSIFVLYNGNHYMRIVFLNTNPNAPDDMKVIDHVPSWDRARWMDMFARYWGFQGYGMANIRRWRERNACLFRDGDLVCRLRLGHGGVHVLT